MKIRDVSLKDLIDINKELQALSSQDDLAKLSEKTTKFVNLIFGATSESMQAMIHSIALAQIQVEIGLRVMSLQPKRELKTFTVNELREIICICFPDKGEPNEFEWFESIPNIIIHTSSGEIVGSAFMEVEFPKEKVFTTCFYEKGKHTEKDLTCNGLLEYLIEIGFY